MSYKQKEMAINKMINIIRPNGVLDIEFEMSSAGNNEYYFGITYVVPDDSIFLRSSDMRYSDSIKREWNAEISKNIRNYLGVVVKIINSGIRSESYHQKMKNS